jgi:type I restriction enzyme S subunit
MKLDDIATLSLGKTPSRSNPKLWDKEKNSKNIWLSIADLSASNQLYIEDSKEYVSDEGAKLFKEVPEETLIMSFKLSIGKLAITKCSLRTNEAIIAMPIKDKKLIMKEYLYYYLSSMNWDAIAGKDIKVKGKTLNKTKLKELPILVPPLAEQQRIVAKLDTAFAEIDRASALTTLKQEEINNFKCSILSLNNKKNDFFKSALNDSEELKIGDICDLMTGGTPSRKVPEYFDNGEIKWLVSGDINKKEIFDCDGRITKEGLNNSSAKFLPENSVLIALNGQGKTRGTVAMLKTKATCNQSLVSIFPKSGVNLNTKYLYYFLEGMYDKIRRITGDSGNDRRGLNMPLIRNIKILLPPITEQENIISKLELAINELDIANRVLDEALKNYKALKSAMLCKELQSSEAA